MRFNQPITRTISDETTTRIEKGNLITTRTVVTETTKTTEQVQKEADQIDAQIATLQVKKEATATLMTEMKPIDIKPVDIIK